MRGERHEFANVVSIVFGFKAPSILKSPKLKFASEKLEMMKEASFDAINTTKNLARNAVFFENVETGKHEVPVLKLLVLLRKLIPKEYVNKVSLECFVLIKNKKIKKDPFIFYSYISQPILNLVKYGDNKPATIKIAKEAGKDGKDMYYAYFINHGTTPIPDDDIDKIIEGQAHRSKHAINKGIKGDGMGFANIVSFIISRGYEKDVPKLIEKGRKEGVCVRLPLIGLAD